MTGALHLMRNGSEPTRPTAGVKWNVCLGELGLDGDHMKRTIEKHGAVRANKNFILEKCVRSVIVHAPHLCQFYLGLFATFHKWKLFSFLFPNSESCQITFINYFI